MEDVQSRQSSSDDTVRNENAGIVARQHDHTKGDFKRSAGNQDESPYEDKSPATDSTRAVAAAAAAPPAPPPDGGWLAWLQVVCAVFTFFNTWGLLNSFGAFQSYYSTTLLRNTSDSDISWIGTIQSCFILLGSIYSGPLFDWGYLRLLIGLGSLLIVVGMFLTSLCYEYWQLVLAQGLCMGIGLGCLFTPTAGIIATYFSRRRALATGIASSGTTFGGILYPIILNQLVGRLGFGWTVRVMAFIMLGTLILPVVGMKQRIRPATARRLFDRSAWRDPEFGLYAASLFVAYIGLYVPYFYVQLYCSELGIITGQLNFYLLPLMNVGNFFGRLALGYLADGIGPMNTYNIASAGCVVLLFGWMGIFSEAGIIVFVILYGFFSAGLMSLPVPVVASALCPDMRQYGMRLTMQLVPAALGLLIGNPIAGVILLHGWRSLQGFAAAIMFVCTALGVAAKVAKAGWKQHA